LEEGGGSRKKEGGMTGGKAVRGKRQQGRGRAG
jgi:hypothetical protein